MSTLTSDQHGGSGMFRVTGVVRFADGIPAARTRVAAFDRDLRSEQPLGEAHTDRNGAYRIEYSRERFLAQDAALPTWSSRSSMPMN
jgi:hypothetical protein